MAILNFPPNPINGQQYPDPPIPGVNVYEFSSSANTWLLLGRAGYAQAGTYGDNVTCVEITIDASGIIRNIINRPIPDVTNTQKGLVVPGIGLNVTVPGRIDLIPPLLSDIGGVKAGGNINIDLDGTISVPYATLATPGVVILNNTTSSTDITQALTAAQGKYLQDQISALVTDALTFCGTYNASTSQLDYVTYEGSLKGFVVGQNIPAPSAALDGTFVIVSIPGTPVAPAPVQLIGSGDWIVCDINPTQWVVVPIGRFIVASQVIFNPYSYVTGTDVQLAINQVVDRTNFFSLSGGIGLSYGPYTLAGGPQTINLLAPTATDIGGVRAGANIIITPSGVISAVAGGDVGTVLEVNTGTGLTGGPITSVGTISIASTGVTPDTYSYPTLSINQQGQVTLASSNTPVTSLTAGAGMAVSAGTGAVTVSQTDTGVVPGDYTFANISIDPQGRITTASSGSVVAGSGLTGGGTGSSVTLNVGAGIGITTNSDAVSIIPPTGSNIGGVKAGANISIAGDGTIAAIIPTTTISILDDISPLFDDFTSLFPLTIGGSPLSTLADITSSVFIEVGGVLQPPTIGYTAINSSIQFTEPPQSGATFSGRWVTDLTSGSGGSGTVTSITAGAGLSGGIITTTGTIAVVPATTSALGGVKPDGTTITVLPDGTISAISGGSVGTLQQVTDNGATTTNTITVAGITVRTGALIADRVGGSETVALDWGGITFNNGGGFGNGVKLSGPPGFGLFYTITLPASSGGAGTTLINNGSGQLSWAIPGDGLYLQAVEPSVTGPGAFGLGRNTLTFGAGNLISFDSDNTNTNKITIQGPNSIPATTNYVLPVDGSAGQVLTTNGAGTLSWSTAGGSVGTLQQVTTAGNTTNQPMRFYDAVSTNESVRIEPDTGLISIFPQAIGDPGVFLGPAAIFFGNSIGSIGSAGLVPCELKFNGNAGAALKTFDPSYPVELWAGGTNLIGTPQVSVTGAATTIVNQMIVSGLSYPATDGAAGEVLSTDGAGVLGWLTTLKVVAAPTNQGDPGAAGDVAYNASYFFWHDGADWQRVAAEPPGW